MISGSRRLGLDRASALGAALFASVGPRTSNHRRAVNNLTLAMPDLSNATRTTVLDQMWRNLGRVAAEYAHLPQLLSEPGRVTFEGMDKCLAVMREGRGGFLLSAHYGNWEMANAFGRHLGLRQANFHRPLANAGIEKLYLDCRAGTVTGPLVPHSDKTLELAVRLIKGRSYIGMLVDHKVNEGPRLPFVGRLAHTNPLPAILARRLRVPILVGRVIRLEGAHFRFECQPVDVERTDDRRADVLTTTRRINDVLSDWIREQPEQWCWVHNRWKPRPGKALATPQAEGAEVRPGAIGGAQ